MTTIAEAWKWYQATERNLMRMRRLGAKHWGDPSLRDASISIWKDDQFKQLEPKDIVNETDVSLQMIDDLAVLVLFSAFESTVRDHLIALIRPEADEIKDPILKQAAEDAIEGVKEGSFSRRVLERLKSQTLDLDDLAAQVNQIRHYRNWVAHGRRGESTNNITPREAFERLRDFLEKLGIFDDDLSNENPNKAREQ
jgi:hypothetical protein